jgi:hypothetical protein
MFAPSRSDRHSITLWQKSRISDFLRKKRDFSARRQAFFGNLLRQTRYRRMRYVPTTPRTNPQSREMENPPSTDSTKPALRVKKFIESVSNRGETPTLSVGVRIENGRSALPRPRPHAKTSAVVHESLPRFVLLRVEHMGFHREGSGAAGRNQQNTKKHATRTKPIFFHDFAILGNLKPRKEPFLSRVYYYIVKVKGILQLFPRFCEISRYGTENLATDNKYMSDNRICT